MRIRVVRTPAGNFARLTRAIESVGGRCHLVGSKDLLRGSDPVVLSGVSSFSTIGRALVPARSVLRDLARDGVPLFGICAGLQALFERSSEGKGRGLGLLEGEVRGLRSPRVPNLGWSRLVVGAPSRLLREVPSGSYAYFAHSYRVPSDVPGVASRTVYRGEWFPSAVEAGSVWGVQFHPEISGAIGRQVLANFVEFCREVAG